MFCVNGFINGTGHTRMTLINNIISTYVIRIPACLLVGTVWSMGLYGIGYALPLASLIQLLVAYGYYFSGRWKKQESMG